MLFPYINEGVKEVIKEKRHLCKVGQKTEPIPLKKTLSSNFLHRFVETFLHARKLIKVFEISKSPQAKVTLNIRPFK